MGKPHEGRDCTPACSHLDMATRPNGGDELEVMASKLREASWLPSIDLTLEQSLELAEIVINMVKVEMQTVRLQDRNALVAAVEDTTAMKQDGIIWIDYEELKRRIRDYYDKGTKS